MLTLVPKRPASSSARISPKKRIKTPSPQKPLYEATYSHSWSPSSKVETMILTPSPFPLLQQTSGTTAARSSVNHRYLSEGWSHTMDQGGNPDTESSNPPSMPFVFAASENVAVGQSQGPIRPSVFDKNDFRVEIFENNEQESTLAKPQASSPELDMMANKTGEFSGHESIGSDPSTDTISTSSAGGLSLSLGSCVVSSLVSHSPKSSIVNNNPKNLDLGFSLVKPGNMQRSPSISEVKIMRSLYPTLRNVIHFPPYIVLVTDSIPESVPRSLCGIPAHFTMDDNDIPLRGEHCRGPPLRIGEATPVWILPSFETRKMIIKSLSTQRVRSLGWGGTRWLLEVENPDESTRTSLPRMINGLITSYRTYTQLSEHGLHRAKISTSVQIDNTDYTPSLHAGMLVSDGDVFTTSGCPVQRLDDSETRYFTIASHGFVTGADVFHPVPAPLGRKVGVANVKFGETDIGLCKITNTTIEYTRDCFAGEMGSIQLRSLKRENECWIGKELYIDAPFTGLGVGIVEMHGIKIIPVDEPDPEWHYVANLWMSFQNGVEDPLPGCCGSPLFDRQGDVYAFFRYFRTDGTGTSYCPCPDPLIAAGYVLATPSPQDSGNVSDADI